MGNAYGLESALNPGAVGTTVTSGGASASTSIPNATNGNRARMVLLTVTGFLYVKFTRGAGTCTTNDMLMSPNYPMPINCQQFDTISYLQETAAAKLNITPLEV